MKEEDASRSAAIGTAREASIASLIGRTTELYEKGANEEQWKPLRDEALAMLSHARDIRWARLKVLDGGRMEKISGAPLHIGKWLGLDREAVEIIRTQGDEADYSRTLFVYDWHSVADIDRLLERSKRWVDPTNILRALSVAAETLMYRHGEFDRACQLLEKQRQMHEAAGSIVEQAKTLVRLTMGLLAAGDLKRAIATRDHAKEMVDRLGPGYLIYEHAGTKRGGDLYPAISMESNFAWYIEGDWKAVGEHWVHAIGLEEPGGSPVHNIETGMAAQAYARIGRFDEAKRLLDELTPVLTKLQPRDWGFNGAVGRSSHAIWDMVAKQFAQPYRDFALNLISAGVGDWTNTSLELTVARMAALLGQEVQSREFFEFARRRLSKKPVDPRLAIIDYDEAVALRLMKTPDRSHRQPLIAGALDTFSKLDMRGWVERAKAELAKE